MLFLHNYTLIITAYKNFKLESCPFASCQLSTILNTYAQSEQLMTYIQGVTGGTDQTSGQCSLGQTIPI